MKYPVIFLVLMLGLAGCGMGNSAEGNSPEEQPGTSVTLTHAVYGHLDRTSVFPAVVVYRNKSAVSAPVSGFIEKLAVEVGMRVEAGQLLYVLESKERHAVGGDGEGGLIRIDAMSDGIVLDVQQTGNYVAEGTVLCTIAESSSLVFEINVPYERRKEVRDGGGCVMELPDGTRLAAAVRLPLASMDEFSQSERVTALVSTSLFLPEGLHVKAMFSVTAGSGRSLILPESAVQSDENLALHWVMKMASDSTAVKVPVEVAGRNSTEIEVVSDGLSPDDAVILTGGYGLEDGAKVIVAGEEASL